MEAERNPVLPDLLPPVAPAEKSAGVLPAQAIRALIGAGGLRGQPPITEEQIQPASIDLRLGARAWRLEASFLPGPDARVERRLEGLGPAPLDLSGGLVLERGQVYLVELMERLELPRHLSASANPKSSTGRLDIFTRLITDRGTAFDRVPRGYRGPLYAEIAPRTFSVRVRPGTRLNQLRFRRGSPIAALPALSGLQERYGLVSGGGQPVIRENLVGLSLDLKGDESGLVGFVARKETGILDLDMVGHYEPAEFWRPIHARPGQGIVLTLDDFYILATKEAVSVPADYAAEMVAYDTQVGEFRVHYAGFFDPGFGVAEAGGAGSRAVLEVRSHEVPFILEHEQIVGWLRYERLTARPDRLYGQGIGSNYQAQGLKLGKHFRAWAG
ncbi:MAG: 2'-deoxycytidine 5'-triphosphate deaminase [Alphaproteobacteria bacterium]|nr:2'-deoxycytidine 5'-triphosphate deaminase [Alphaproteobacteria bacterium]